MSISVKLGRLRVLDSKINKKSTESQNGKNDIHTYA